MKTRTFNYTKDSGEVTTRTAIVVAAPRTHYLMLDVSHVDPDVMADILEELNDLEAQKETLFGILDKKWRTFKATGIEWIDE